MRSYISNNLDFIQRKYGSFQVLRHGFWFIDIPRTSSSSIRLELGRKFGFPYGKKDLIDTEYRDNKLIDIFPSHMTAQEARYALGKSVWDRIFKFTIVRNPWERVYSLYAFRKKRGRTDETLSFRDYILSLYQHSINNNCSSLFKYPPHYYGSSDFILDSNGEIMVDYIAKYEDREHGLKSVASKIGFSELGGLHTQRAASEAKHYSCFYDSETKEIVRNIYKKDVELFDYQFNYM